jgi:hypothetical protein
MPVSGLVRNITRKEYLGAESINKIAGVLAQLIAHVVDKRWSKQRSDASLLKEVFININE